MSALICVILLAVSVRAIGTTPVYTISKFMGTGSVGSGSPSPTPALSFTFSNNAEGIWLGTDASTIYVADINNHVLVKVTLFFILLFLRLFFITVRGIWSNCHQYLR